MKTLVHVEMKDAVRVEVLEIQKSKFLGKRVKVRTHSANELPRERWLTVGDAINFSLNALFEH